MPDMPEEIWAVRGYSDELEGSWDNTVEWSKINGTKYIRADRCDITWKIDNYNPTDIVERSEGCCSDKDSTDDERCRINKFFSAFGQSEQTQELIDMAIDAFSDIKLLEQAAGVK